MKVTSDAGIRQILDTPVGWTPNEGGPQIVDVVTNNSIYTLFRGKVSGGILPEPIRYDHIARLKVGRGMLVLYKGKQVLHTSAVKWVEASRMVRV